MERTLPRKTALRLMIGLALSATLALDATAGLAKNAPAPATKVEDADKKACRKVDDKLKTAENKKCAIVAQAEPKVARTNGFLQLIAVPFVAGSAVVAAAISNQKNCGKGNNSQNNGNCPASP